MRDLGSKPAETHPEPASTVAEHPVAEEKPAEQEPKEDAHKEEEDGARQESQEPQEKSPFGMRELGEHPEEASKTAEGTVNMAEVKASTTEEKPAPNPAKFTNGMRDF